AERQSLAIAGDLEAVEGRDEEEVNPKRDECSAEQPGSQSAKPATEHDRRQRKKERCIDAVALQQGHRGKRSGGDREGREIQQAHLSGARASDSVRLGVYGIPACPHADRSFGSSSHHVYPFSATSRLS